MGETPAGPVELEPRLTLRRNQYGAYIIRREPLFPTGLEQEMALTRWAMDALMRAYQQMERERPK